MERIMVVEDEANIRRLLTDFLKDEGYETISVRDGETALEMTATRSPDLIILDIMLPKKSGFDVCRELRAKNTTTPIIMLTAKSQEVDKVLGLELGADDYITKPFSLNEIHARIRALMRRCRKDTTTETNIERYEIGDRIIDLKGHAVIKGRKTFPLSSLEAVLLAYFIRHRGDVVSRNELLDKVWGYERFPTTRTIDTHILNLRKKIEENPDKPIRLLTIHGTGYRFAG